MPVPIDQTGSYAKIILLFLLILLRPRVIWEFKIKLVLFFLFSFNVSPIQKITFKFFFSADLILRLII